MKPTRRAFSEPSSNGVNSRLTDDSGKFAKGNKGGPGNPFVKRVAALRSALYEEVSPGDLRKMIRKLKDLAFKGDVAATKVLLDRLLGKPQADVRHIISGDEALRHAVEKQDRMNEMFGRG